MSAVYVDVTIRNSADRQRSWTGKFLIDTGAFDSLVPRVRLEEIGLEPIRGRNRRWDHCIWREAEPLLGVTALESGGFEVVPRNEELKRLPDVLLKASVSQGFVHRSGRA